jgi:hypothetical protein
MNGKTTLIVIALCALLIGGCATTGPKYISPREMAELTSTVHNINFDFNQLEKKDGMRSWGTTWGYWRGCTMNSILDDEELGRLAMVAIKEHPCGKAALAGSFGAGPRLSNDDYNNMMSIKIKFTEEHGMDFGRLVVIDKGKNVYRIVCSPQTYVLGHEIWEALYYAGKVTETPHKYDALNHAMGYNLGIAASVDTRDGNIEGIGKRNRAFHWRRQ